LHLCPINFKLKILEIACGRQTLLSSMDDDVKKMSKGLK